MGDMVRFDSGLSDLILEALIRARELMLANGRRRVALDAVEVLLESSKNGDAELSDGQPDTLEQLIEDGYAAAGGDPGAPPPLHPQHGSSAAVLPFRQSKAVRRG